MRHKPERKRLSLDGLRSFFFSFLGGRPTYTHLAEPVHVPEVRPTGDVALPEDVRSVEDVRPTEDVRPAENVDTAAPVRTTEDVETTRDVDPAIGALSGVLVKDHRAYITNGGEIVRELNAPRRKPFVLTLPPTPALPSVPAPSLHTRAPLGPVTGFQPPIGLAPLMGYQPPVSVVFTPWQPPV